MDGGGRGRHEGGDGRVKGGDRREGRDGRVEVETGGLGWEGARGWQERREGWDSGVARLGGVTPGPSTEEEGQMDFRKSSLNHLMWNSLTIICL